MSRPPVRGWCAAVVALALAGCAPAEREVPDSTVVGWSHGVVEHVPAGDGGFGDQGDYSIYLPPGYGQDPQRRYPVLYLLHPGGGDDRTFIDLGLPAAMDTAIDARAVAPMLVVLPDAGPKFTGADGVGPDFDAWFAGELVPSVDRRWRTEPQRTGRAVGGISLGGRHALAIAAGHPSLVSAVGGHSTTIANLPPDAVGRLAEARVPVWIDVGESDGLFPEDEEFAASLRRSGADVQWHHAEGEHAEEYWSAHLPEYLRFYSDALAAG